MNYLNKYGKRNGPARISDETCFAWIGNEVSVRTGDLNRVKVTSSSVRAHDR